MDCLLLSAIKKATFFWNSEFSLLHCFIAPERQMGGKNMYHLLDIALRLPFNCLDWQQHTDQGFLYISLSFLFKLLYL